MQGREERLFTLGGFTGTISVIQKDGVWGISIAGTSAASVLVTGNITSIDGIASTPIEVNNTKPTLTLVAGNGSSFDGVTIDCVTNGASADIIMLS